VRWGTILYYVYILIVIPFIIGCVLVSLVCVLYNHYGCNCSVRTIPVYVAYIIGLVIVLFVRAFTVERLYPLHGLGGAHNGVEGGYIQDRR